MSFPKNDRKVRSESGKTFPNGGDGALDSSFRALISQALRRDFGQSPGAVKTVARLVNANERAVRNWFEARNGPSGEHLVALMARSETVLETVLILCGRQELKSALLISRARDALLVALEALDSTNQPDG